MPSLLMKERKWNRWQAQHLLTMSQNHPSTASETSSQEQERLRQEEEYEQALKEQEENEEDQDDDCWEAMLGAAALRSPSELGRYSGICKCLG